MKALSSLATLSLALMLTSCSFTQQVADAPAAEPNAEQAGETTASKEKKQEETPAPVPSDEQQKAAEQLLTEASEAPAAPEADIPTPAEGGAPTPSLPTGGLRMGSIILQEDPASTGDAPPPTANAAERFGLRSPKMPGKLPMGIDGKLKTEQ